MEEDSECAIDKVNFSKASIIQHLLAIYHQVPQEQCLHSGYLPETVFIRSVILFIH
uniref:Uncharacterized protein n=1 Tax=Solanum tuberosum TaxID=4113 RepID=M1CGC4_SOLTU